MNYTVVQVALGGAVGASLRYLAGRGAFHLMGPGFPWGTIFVNIFGSFLMGVLVVLMAEKGGTRMAPFLTVGMLGGFTTFSSFSLDFMTIFERGQSGLAFVYAAASVILSLAAIAAGLFAARSVFS